MEKVVKKVDQMLITAKGIIIMFIIIAVAAGIAGLLYIFGTKTLLPDFQTKITSLINQWFDGH